MHCVALRGYLQVLREELGWLNYFPAGFKLNVPLTHTLGSCTLFGMEAYASMVGKVALWEVRNVMLHSCFPSLVCLGPLRSVCSAAVGTNQRSGLLDMPSLSVYESILSGGLHCMEVRAYTHPQSPNDKKKNLRRLR